MKVLVVDDNENIRDLAKAILQAEEYEVIAAADGIAALEAIRTDPCDILVTDMEMPWIDGIELIQMIKADRPRMPVVLMTGKVLTEPEMMDLMSSRGADFVLQKPFGVDALVDAVASVLTSARSRCPDPSLPE